MRDRNDHEVTFHAPCTLGTAMAEREHMPHPLHDETTGHAMGSKPGARTREYITRDHVRDETGTDSP